MSLFFINEDQNVWEPETDPLEIKEEIHIKEEKIDGIKEELVDIDKINDADKQRNVSNLLKNKITKLSTLNTTNCKSIKIIRLNNSINSGINKTTKNATCKCMTSIEYYCIKCDKAFFYSKDKNICSDCNTLLKLQCKMCHKRYKILNTVSQVSQPNKEVSVPDLANQTDVSVSEKNKTLVCSKCTYNTNCKDLLEKHMDRVHQEDTDKYLILYCPNCFRTCEHSSYEGIERICQCNTEMVYRCILCKKMYKRLKNMRDHIRHICLLCIQNEKLHCVQCTFKADSQPQLDLHEKTYHKLIICANCNKEFVGTIKLEEHISQGCDIAVSLIMDESSTLIAKGNDEAKSHLSNNEKNTVLSKPLCKKEPSPILISSDEDINSLDRLNVQENIDPLSPATVLNKQKRPIPAAGIDEETNYHRESIHFLDDEDCFKIVDIDPHTIIDEIESRPIEDSTCWSTLIIFFCLYCNEKAKEEFSKCRPQCPKCLEKYDYRCMNCEKLFGSYPNIFRHLKTECLNRQTFKCPLCEFSSIRKHYLVTHIKTKHTIYECLHCNCRYNGYLSLKYHQKLECNIEHLQNLSDVKKLITLYCENCFKRIKISETVRIMCKTCKNSMKYQCLKCNRKFDDRDIIYKHVEEECKPILYCKLCSYKAYIQHDLDIHLKHEHTNKKCPDCGVQFKDAHVFSLHLLEEERKKEKRKSEFIDTRVNQPLITVKSLDTLVAKMANNDSTDITLPEKKFKSA